MKTPKKLDLYVQYKAEYVTPKNPVLLQASPAQYLAIDGRGEPGGAEFQMKIGALYNVAFTIKMARKFAGQDYAVSKLEGLWSENNRTIWTLCIRIPDFIGAKDLKGAVRKLLDKGKDPEVGEVKVRKLKEGQSVQILHVGPYDQCGATIEVMRKFATGQGLAFRGAHHEIYLSDPRRVAPAKLRTILRHPVS
ncbi:MAG TPA: GyrI-like domain-containing protein [Bryobacteraceae bacterium]|nr:GyrI-like domain-containing protein [Bryobacteraceae bacterium]